MQPFPIPYGPSACLPRSPSATLARSGRNERSAVRQPGPTLVFGGVALAIFGVATMLATCIASFG